MWGSAPDDVFVVGTGGIHHYDGAAWSPLPQGMPTEPILHAIWGNSPDDVFTVGQAGVILRYDGSVWSPMATGTNGTFYGVGGSSSGDVFAVGLSGLIYHFDGAGWSPMAGGTTQHLYDVWAGSPSDVYAVGGDALHYDGDVWAEIDLPGGYGVWGSSPTDVFATCGGWVMHYDGASWTESSFWVGQTLKGVFGLSECDVFAVGGGGAIVHYGDMSTVAVLISRFEAASGKESVELTWRITGDESITGFRIYRRDERDPIERRLDTGGIIARSVRRYSDTTVQPGVRYRYTLAVVVADGGEVRSRAVEVQVPVLSVALLQNQPNPFNPATRIRFSVPQKAHVVLRVFDLEGKLIVTLIRETVDPGLHELEWDGRNGRGQEVGTGVYFYRLEAAGQVRSRKMVLLK